MPNSPAATPVEQLREQAKRLEAALSVGVATATAKAVHELRSSTRRVEAQLELLAMVHGLPTYKPQAEKLLRRLAILRRKAGRVRDCDVHTKFLKDGDHAMTSATGARADLAKTQEKLSRSLSKARDRRERKLIAEIERQLPRVARNTEKLLAALKPAEDRKIPVAELLAPIEQKIERMLRSRERGEDHLHNLRKTAKRARYQCESLPGPQAAAMAKRFEQLQDAGGAWHDLLDLATVCHTEFGAEHPLSRVLEHLRDERLDSYLANLEDYRRTHNNSTPRRKPPQRPTPSSRPAAKGRRATAA